MPKRRIMRALKINEISAVDVPAQEGAVAVILKRKHDDGKKKKKEGLEKKVRLTTATRGHAHIVDTESFFDRVAIEGGETSSSVSAGKERSHDHPWVLDPDGSITIGEAEGHTHEVIEAASTFIIAGADKSADSLEEETTMPTDKTDSTKALKDLQKQLDQANSVAALNDAEKAHFGALEADEAGVFLAKSVEERGVIIKDLAKRAQDEDPVVYTTVDGIELRKSMGEVTISMAKSNDLLRKTVAELTAEAEETALEKRAEELEHIPGDLDTRVAMIKAIDGIEDSTQREAALKALAAQNEALALAFKAVGHSNTPVPGSTAEQLGDLAKAYKKDNPKVSIEQAENEVLKTAEGAELYAKMVN